MAYFCFEGKALHFISSDNSQNPNKQHIFTLLHYITNVQLHFQRAVFNKFLTYSFSHLNWVCCISGMSCNHPVFQPKSQAFCGRNAAFCRAPNPKSIRATTVAAPSISNQTPFRGDRGWAPVSKPFVTSHENHKIPHGYPWKNGGFEFGFLEIWVI